MTTERAIIIRNALADSILKAGTDAFKNTKDLMVLEYWLHCYYVNTAHVLGRLASALDTEQATEDNICDIYNYIAENK